MAFVSINQITLRPGRGAEVEDAIGPFVRARQELIRRGDLLAMHMARSEDQTGYALVSVWASREAHDRSEDSPAEQAAMSQLAKLVAAPPTEFTGEVIAELP
jgi:heme-degrading monooxygenase HmoA